jgi:DNA repair photolyase
VRSIDRRGPVLTPSGLACLVGAATVNVTSGCAHDCVYCYARGYTRYPGDGVVVVYGDTARRIAQELPRKRRRPRTVYFCPSCDAFQPLETVLDQSFQSMAAALDGGAGVEFVTKGAVPEGFLALFRDHPGRVAAQVGLTTLDDGLRRLLEPGAASVGERLRGVVRLREAGVHVSIRADPLIHDLTDTDAGLRALLAASRECGVTDVAASYLFLRPAIAAGLTRSMPDRALAARLLAPYAHGSRFTLRGGASGGVALPHAIRRAGFDRMARLAAEHGLRVHVCGCKNADVTRGRCHLIRYAAGDREPALPEPPPGLLWDSGAPDSRRA